MKICLLASGSSGNCTLIASDTTKILVDAGISLKRVIEGLCVIGIDPEGIDALLITHEHADHCREVSVLSRWLGCPVYMSERTFKAIRWALGTELLVKLFKVGEEFPLKDFCIRPFRVFHDAVDPCGFRIEGERRKVKVGLATDLGVVTPEVEDNLRGCDVVILEANHDLEMLLEGPYPWELKQRIQSQVGHLSNNAAGEALAKLGEIQKVFLAHLSRINNTPQLALSTISNYLKDKKPDLFPSYHEWMSEVVEI